MSSLSPKDRVSLCSFTFSDGRRCLSPRGKDPRFCPYHAQKAARARATKKLGKDLTYFFSGDYLSACDLSTALARLIPAVVRGDVKPKTAHTVAYLVQTLMQAIHLSKHEYINAFGTDDWRQAIRNSVTYNHDYRFPPAPKLEQPAPSALQANLRSESPQPQPQPQPTQPQTQPPPAQAQQPAQPQTQAQQPPTPSPHAPLPATSAEFVQQVVAGLQTGQKSSPTPNPPQPASTTSRPTPPADTPVNCHSACPDLVGERSEESAFSESKPSYSPLVTHHSFTPTLSGPLPQPHQPAPPTVPAIQPDNPLPAAPRAPQPGPNRDAPWLTFSPTPNIPPDSHLL